jgi:branched-subunit amino acid transport protein
MSVWTAIVIVLAVAVGTYLMRAVPLLVLADRDLPPMVERALRNVGPAVLSALVVVTVASSPDGVSIDPIEVTALVVAGVVAWWRKNLIWSLVAGMLALWITAALFG